MMIQTAPDGAPRFISSMRQHNAFCEQLVRAFGNSEFEDCQPHEEVVYAISHHDYGWDELDASPIVSQENGFPQGLGNAPVKGIIDTGPLSVEFNQARHPYCGLLLSMHIWGLYNARYGLSNFEVRRGGSRSIPVTETDQMKRDRMLSDEVLRQESLLVDLRQDEAMAPWIEEGRIRQNYKLMQFIDTLALYFHLRHETQRDVEVFVHVPKGRTDDTSVTLTPRGNGVYELDPFPFAGERLELACAGRSCMPFDKGLSSAQLAQALNAVPISQQRHTFIRA